MEIRVPSPVYYSPPSRMTDDGLIFFILVWWWWWGAAWFYLSLYLSGSGGMLYRQGRDLFWNKKKRNSPLFSLFLFYLHSLC